MPADIMTPAHPKWDEFAGRLEGPEGCDFKEDGTWKCAGGMNKPKAEAILHAMGFSAESIVASLRHFEANGGHCDCEILFNVAP